MKNFKKVLAIILSLACVACVFSACGTTDTETTTVATDETESQTSFTTITDGVITFGTNAEFPPFESVSANGIISSADGSQSFDGIDMAIANKIGEKYGMKAVINNMEFDSLLISLKNGQLDACIAGMTVTEDRKEEVDFSTPYYVATQVMIVKEGSDIKSAADMEGKKIAVVQGYTGETVVNELGYEYEAFKKGTECVMELTNGKCDVVVIDSATADKYVADNEGLVIVTDSEAFESEEYAIAVAKGNTALLDAINTAIEELKADGTIASLSAQYAVSE